MGHQNRFKQTILALFTILALLPFAPTAGLKTAHAGALAPGDIAFVEYNADGTDNFKFVALATIPGGEVINFTDNGWKSDNTWRTGEGIVTWTAPADGVSCGTVVSITTAPSTSHGSVSESGDLNFSASGDQIIAYQDASTMIAALNNEGDAVWQSDATNSNTSALPQGLANSTNAVAINEVDNIAYGGLTSGTKATLLAALNDQANWSGGSDSDPQAFVETITVTDCGDAAPSVSSTTPANGAGGVAVDADVSVNFSEDVAVTGNWYDITCASSGSHAAVVSGGPQLYTLNPDTDFVQAESCTVTVYAAQVTDLDGNDPPDLMASDHSWSFGVTDGSGCAAELFISEYVEGSSYNKAIEIVNATGATVDLSAGAYDLQLFFNGNTEPGTTIALAGTLANGDVYVVCHSSADATILAACDQSGNVSFNGDDAVALRKGGAYLDVIGQIGNDPGAEWSGGGDLGTADNTIRRKDIIRAGDPDGSDDFNNELITEWNGYAQDTFDGLGAHTVQCGEIAPYVVGTTPSHNASNVAEDANLVVNFSEDVTATGTWYAIQCAASGSHAATVSGGPQSFTLDPEGDFAPCERCTVSLLASQVTDQDTDDPPDAMGEDYSFAFTTACSCNTICELQGEAHLSPCSGQAVSDIWGIVTAVGPNGYWIEHPGCDANAKTSDGVFVYTDEAGKPAVGDEVLVSGSVAEYYSGGYASGNLAVTEIGSNPSFTVQSSGNSTTPTVVGSGGRVPPNTITDNDSVGDANTTPNFDPDEDGLDFWESLEGMLVQVNGPIVVAGTSGYGEITVVGDGGANSNSLSPRGGLVRQENDYNPERIVIDDMLITNTLVVDTGASFAGPIVGVMHYSYGMFTLYNTAALPAVSGGVSQEIGPAPRTNQISLATFNVENLDPGDPPAKFEGLASRIVTNLRSPDILILEEVQDNNGATNDSVVEADLTYTALISAIIAAGGPTYSWRDIAPEDDQDGGEPGGNIRVAFLFRTDCGLSFTDRGDCGASDAVSVSRGAFGQPRLSCSPGRIDPANPAFSDSRKSLVAEFEYVDLRAVHHRLFVIANHFNSKGGDASDFGRIQPPQRSSEIKRIAQAEAINAFVDQILAANAHANVIVGGDLNDFEFSAPLAALKGTPPVLTDLVYSLPEMERYTYVYQGTGQVLDHILLSDNLFNQHLRTIDVVHINAEFAVANQLSDHDPLVAILNFNRHHAWPWYRWYCSGPGHHCGYPQWPGDYRICAIRQIGQFTQE